MPSDTDQIRQLPLTQLFVGLVASACLLALFSTSKGLAILLLLPLLIVAGLFYKFPSLGLIAMAALAVTNVSDNLIASFGLPSVAKLAGPGLIFVLSARWILLRERPLINLPALAVFTGYGTVIALSMAWAEVWSVSKATTLDYIKDVVTVMLTLAFFNKKNALQVYVMASMAMLTLICLLCLYQYVSGDFSNDFAGFARFIYDSHRLSGPIQDPNFFAANLVFFTPIALGMVLLSETWTTRLLGAFVFSILLTSIVLTASRGALVALALSLPFFVFILERRTLLPLIGICFCLFAVSSLFLSEELVQRFELMFVSIDEGAISDTAIEGRLASWAVAAELFIKHPLGGVGAGNYNLFFQDTAVDLGLIFRGEGRSAHSLYLEILAETGLMGLLAFMAIAIAAMAGVVTSTRRLRQAKQYGPANLHATFGVGLFGFLVAMIFLHDSYPRLLYTLLAIAVAMPKIAQLHLEQEGARDAHAPHRLPR